MVLSGSNKTSSMASITNRSSSGGNKKAGLPSRADGRSMWSQVALNGTTQKKSLLKLPESSTTRPSRPIGVRPMSWM